VHRVSAAQPTPGNVRRAQNLALSHLSLATRTGLGATCRRVAVTVSSSTTLVPSSQLAEEHLGEPMNLWAALGLGCPGFGGGSDAWRRTRRLDRHTGTAPGRAASVPSGADAGQELHHVSDQIVGPLGIVDHHQAPPLGGQGLPEVLDPEARQTIPVLDPDRRHLRVPQQTEQRCAMPVQAGTDLGDDLGRRHVHRRDLPDHAGHLAVQVGALIARRGHPRVERHAAPTSRRLLDQDRPRRQLASRHRQHAGTPTSTGSRSLSPNRSSTSLTGPMGATTSTVTPAWLSAITRTSRFPITETRDDGALHFLAVSVAEEGNQLKDPPPRLA
jgi:hypothetical protein